MANFFDNVSSAVSSFLKVALNPTPAKQTPAKQTLQIPHSQKPLPGDAEFQAWKTKYAPQDSGIDYDLRAAFKAGITPSQTGHWPDTYKLPNHPTFSVESIYSTPSKIGGRWANEKGQDVFYASPVNLQSRTPQDLINYFSKYEPGVKLVLPK